MNAVGGLDYPVVGKLSFSSSSSRRTILIQEATARLNGAAMLGREGARVQYEDERDQARRASGLRRGLGAGRLQGKDLRQTTSVVSQRFPGGGVPSRGAA